MQGSGFCAEGTTGESCHASRCSFTFGIRVQQAATKEAAKLILELLLVFGCLKRVLIVTTGTAPTGTVNK